MLTNNLKSVNDHFLVPLNISADGFAFDPTRGESYILNSSGCWIIQQLQQGKNQAEIVNLICGKFDVSHNSVKRDVNDFIHQLHLLGIMGVNQ